MGTATGASNVLIRRGRWLGLALLLLIALWLRARFLSHWQLNFDADEAVIALQASEILHGHFALFLPGQAYMGTLQSLLAALPLAISHTANAARLAPLIWVPIGFLVLMLLERKAHGALACGRGLALLALAWFFAPAVLFLAGIKVRGGNLEGLVLGFLALALIWPTRAASSLLTSQGNPAETPHFEPPRPLEWLAAGMALGLAIWTHDQALAFLPLVVFVLIVHPGRRVLRAIAAMLGWGIGYLPLWFPRVMPFSLGPPGLERAGVPFDIGGLFSLAPLKLAWPTLMAALSTRPDRTSGASILMYLYAVIVLALVVNAVVSALRSRTANESLITRILRHPSLAIALWLALLNAALLCASPEYVADPQWFRYTLGIAVFLAIASASGLAALPIRASVIGGTLLIALSSVAALQAREGWEVPPNRVTLTERLIAMRADRVMTDWELAYVVTFLSEGRIICNSMTPPRYPDANATVDFAAADWVVRQRGGLARTETADPVDRFYRIDPVSGAPPDVAAAFSQLDLERTLFPHFEPFPLLDKYEKDWRGWPYRRPLSRFQAIVWEPDRAAGLPVAPAVIEEAIRRLEEQGTFRAVASWGQRRILVRASSSSNISINISSDGSESAMLCAAHDTGAAHDCHRSQS